MPRYTSKCCIVGCKSNDLSFHKFPNQQTDTGRLRQWLKIIKKNDNSFIHEKMRICTIHFEDKFKSVSSNRLCKNAYPTLHLMPGVPTEMQKYKTPNEIPYADLPDELHLADVGTGDVLRYSKVVPGFRENTSIYIDLKGYSYYQHSVRRNTRYLRCSGSNTHGCTASAKMTIEDGSPIIVSKHNPHDHRPQPIYDSEVLNRIREMGTLDNVQAQLIFDAQQLLDKALEMGEQLASEQTIARARTPPVSLTLREWSIIFESVEWGPILVCCNGTADKFFQGPLEIFEEYGRVQFVGLVFCNMQFLQQMNVHMPAVRTLCVNGTFQVRPNKPSDIAQLLTIQIVMNNVAIPIIHAVLKDLTTATYIRTMQFLRNDLNLNFSYKNIQIITDFKQELRNAIMRVFPEATNTGCWFHYIHCITRFVSDNGLTQLCNTNENARCILRMLMVLPHLPAHEIEYHHNRFSIQLGFRVIQDFVRDCRLGNDLHFLMNYYERFWMDVIGPSNFTIHQLWHQTNNFIESYHTTLVRLMGEHPSLYFFYEMLRGIEESSRADFSKAVNGQPVQCVEYRDQNQPKNNIVINNAWEKCKNGLHTLQEFIRDVSYTSEELLRQEIGEPNFIQSGLIPNVQMPPLPPLRSLLQPPRPSAINLEANNWVPLGHGELSNHDALDYNGQRHGLQRGGLQYNGNHRNAIDTCSEFTEEVDSTFDAEIEDRNAIGTWSEFMQVDSTNDAEIEVQPVQVPEAEKIEVSVNVLVT